tara:strand:- start:673 stop:1767 length:1095 start_codon:yes stop_codon:yes gene_type:complete
MPPKPEGEPTPEPIGKLYKTWEVSAFNKTTEEWETTTNHGYEYSQTPEDIAEVFEPAVAAKITPTKRKRAERMGKQILVFGDSQIGYHRVYDQEGNDSLIPTHSESALSVLTQINAHERPDTVVNVSDTVDLAEFGRFDPQSDSFHRTLSPSFQRAHNLYAQLRSDNPDGHLVEVDSNHTTRVHKNIMKKMPEMYGFTLPGEKYPLMSYYRLANLGVLDVDFIPGYGAAEFVYGEEYGAPGIIFKHGTTTSSGAGATVRKESGQNPNHHVVRGHGHSYESIAQTTRNGDQLYYTQMGTTCDNKGAVPSYGSAMDDFGHPRHKQENWQNQLMMIEDFEDGTYNFNMINIANGIAKYKGVRYDGNE